MSDVTYQRSHTLGLEKARELAKEWVGNAAGQLGLTCDYQEGGEQDTVTFERMGVKRWILMRLASNRASRTRCLPVWLSRAFCSRFWGWLFVRRLASSSALSR